MEIEENGFNRKYYKLCFIIYMFINTLALGYLGIETNYLFVPLLIWALVIIVHDIYKKFKLKELQSANDRSRTDFIACYSEE